MITVKICRGTVCHVMGGSDLPLLSEFLPEELKNEVIVEGTTCFGSCNDNDEQKPPFAVVDGVIISEATFPKIIEQIKLALKK